MNLAKQKLPPISIPAYTLNRIASCLCRRILSAILSEHASYRGISECKQYKVGRIFCVRRLHSIEVRLRHLNALVVEKHIRNVSVSHSTFCALSKSLDKLLVCPTEWLFIEGIHCAPSLACVCRSEGAVEEWQVSTRRWNTRSAKLCFSQCTTPCDGARTRKQDIIVDELRCVNGKPGKAHPVCGCQTTSSGFGRPLRGTSPWLALLCKRDSKYSGAQL